MLRYPGTSSNLYREQLVQYNHLQRKITQAKLRKSPYGLTKQNLVLPTLANKPDNSRRVKQRNAQNKTFAKRLMSVECRTARQIHREDHLPIPHDSISASMLEKLLSKAHHLDTFQTQIAQIYSQRSRQP